MSNFIERERQLRKVMTQAGFLAALDQSGGSTPKALAGYGIGTDAWKAEEEMFSLVHAMRVRVMESPVFNGDRILGAILFEGTMDREVDGEASADYLWNRKRIVPFLKVDKGLEPVVDGVQLMKPMLELPELLARAAKKNIFGTKMRSVIKEANAVGIRTVVEQQFAVANQILDAGLMPIIEPEVDIHCSSKAEAEDLLKAELIAHLDKVSDGRQVMLKLTIPEKDNLYSGLIEHPRVLKVVALSGGYPRQKADERLARQHGMIASFSRALLEVLKVDQTNEEFDEALDMAIQGIYEASMT